MTLPKNQTAFVHRHGDKPTLDKTTIEVPEPAEGEVLLKVGAAGMCHSDLHILCSDNPIPLDFVMGHEIAGTVVKLGQGVDKDAFPVGRLFAVHGPNGCGSCANCRMGVDNQCQEENHRMYGLGRGGGYQEYVTVRKHSLVPVPDGLSAAVAAVTTDAVLTPYHAIKKAGVNSFSRVLVIGLGGLGLNGVQILKVLGAHVTCVDLREDPLRKAREYGADSAVTSLKNAPMNVDAVFDFVGSNKTFTLSIKHAKPTGIVIPVGLADVNLQFNQHLLSQREVRVISTFWGTSSELMECLELVAKGRVDPQVETAPLSGVNEYLKLLEEGKIKSRLALVPQ
ncbi:alcohol dehydrogenase 2 [Trichomonascus vanleenenianus]|uniref:zinc-binding dehydrogenase n=1 Tax=Trichomonascus vanleenenianus TaxID=2268995 RepID=UPI003ECB1B18